MRAIVLNTGTELLLGDVQDAHLAFIARHIFPLGLRIEERRTVSDGVAIRETLAEIFSRAEILFVTGGLGPMTDDVTREAAAELLAFGMIPEFICRLPVVSCLDALTEEELVAILTEPRHTLVKH